MRGPSYCYRCDRSFPHGHALQQHLDNSQYHNFCACCPTDFPSYDELQSHVDEDHFKCGCCDAYFSSAEEREEHEHDFHFYCGYCDRTFLNHSCLRAHLNSAFHIGRTIICICNAGFPTVSALCLHIEEGGCPDTNDHMLRHIALMMEWDDGHQLTFGEGPLFTDPEDTLQEYVLERAGGAKTRNGSRFLCYCCGVSFWRRTELVRHLYGPVVERNGRGLAGFECGICARAFVRVSGLLQHRESGSCE